MPLRGGGPTLDDKINDSIYYDIDYWMQNIYLAQNHAFDNHSIQQNADYYACIENANKLIK